MRLMVLEGQVSVGIPGAGRGGVGLDPPAALLSDLAGRAGAGRVDGPQVDPADRRGDGGGVDPSLIETALREKRFRPRAVRIDSTVVEADVRYPTDADLASHGVQVLAREGSQARRAGEGAQGASAGSIPVGGPQAPGADPHDPPPVWGGEGGGAGVDRADRRAAAAVGHRSAASSLLSPSAERSGVARAPSAARRRNWRSSQTAARRSPPRSANESRASRSPTGWCRSRTRTPARSARASSASPTSSGTSARSAR